MWLNSLPVDPLPPVTEKDARLLRKSALYIWRYFSEFSGEEQNWLIPDNVQSSPLPNEPRKVAANISPTNVGLLLNSRQVAHEFGYITVAEMVESTQKTLATLDRMRKYRGHLMNWYDTHTLEAKAPFFISSVDSGNLVASLWTLQQGCLDRLSRPLLSKALANGFIDHLRVLANFRAIPKRVVSDCEENFRKDDWLTAFLNFSEESLGENEKNDATAKSSPDLAWFQKQTKTRIQSVRALVETYMPWRLSEFTDLREKVLAKAAQVQDTLPLRQLPDLISEIEIRLEEALPSAQNGSRSSSMRLKLLLEEARTHATTLIDSLHQASLQAHALAQAMDFKFLVEKQRLLMSVGFDAQTEELQPYYYDLLATEPRTAVFVAIAKEDIPQDYWFRLDRPFTITRGRQVLLSWTGTMFEYLMPTIWMRNYPNTLLDRATLAAVRTQQEYAAEKGIVWGISESASAKRNDAGDYHYEAFGVPDLALQKNESEPLIVSPYSTFLALNVDRKDALANLHRMHELKWFGSYGFYEAADYTAPRKRLWGRRYELVQSWMVHHQGMSFLALANCLCDNVVQKWFHRDRRVQATELLLQEKPVSGLYAR
jgi:hypothetical protein